LWAGPSLGLGVLRAVQLAHVRPPASRTAALHPKIYVLREILHDWDDTDALRILKQVGAPGGGGLGWHQAQSSPAAGARAAANRMPPSAPPPLFTLPPHPQVRAAIGRHASAKLVIVEAALASTFTSTASGRIGGDIHMLVQYGGAKERTEREFDDLLAASGFELRRVVPTKGLFFVLEAAPV
jgi:hypothetical protein